ncbi:NlpC/P60 family protein [Dactylosporangium salmoneum]|uniref:NlpC/P60 domain-containing protein n=1 Tax=Dactylosporangium salmoneum TaxID=53361 RepID=A0ABN3I5F7_9ACTN
MAQSPNTRRGSAIVVGVAFVLIAALTVAAYSAVRLKQGDPIEISLGTSADPLPSSGYAFRRVSEPPGTEVVAADGSRVALLTDGSRSARLKGPARTFVEPRFTNAKITHDVYVRLLPQEWAAGAEQQPWFAGWLATELVDPKPDVLATALEYTYGAQPKKDEKGVQYSGDAAFGPLSASDRDGRAENSDFYDYLGLNWTFPDGKKEKPSPDRLHSLDCSGFIRMVYGYRMGLPLRDTDTAGPGLPRRAFAIAEFGPGVLVIENTGKRPSTLDRLEPGDLVFFYGSPEIDSDGADRPTHIEHSGIYMGIDDRGHQRFISSRVGANGPTMGDAGGEAILDGTGHFATALRASRRL